MSEPLPKQELLIKLLKMTTAGDAEALVAIRKANELLTSAGWDWEKLIHGKIVVVGDPFASLQTPPVREPVAAKPQSYGRPYKAPPPPPPSATPAWRPLSTPVQSRMPNKFEGHCYCCGRLVAVGGGFIFKPSEYHRNASSKGFSVICTTDNITVKTILPSPAPRQGPGARKVTADDLA